MIKRYDKDLTSPTKDGHLVLYEDHKNIVEELKLKRENNMEEAHTISFGTTWRLSLVDKFRVLFGKPIKTHSRITLKGSYSEVVKMQGYTYVNLISDCFFNEKMQIRKPFPNIENDIPMTKPPVGRVI